MRPHKMEIDHGRNSVTVIHVDLDHVLLISEPQFIDRMGRGGYFAEFCITLAFRDEPFIISVSCDASYSAANRLQGPKLIDGVPEGVHRLRKVFDKLYAAWVGESC